MKNLFVVILSLFVILIGCTTDDSPDPDSDMNMIGSEGGTVSTPDNTVVLVVPSNALSQETEITIVESTSHPTGNIGTVYDLGPDGLQFSSSAQLTFTYSDDDLGSIDESALTLAFVENGEWANLTSVVDSENNTVTASISHFTEFGIVELPTNSGGGCKLLSMIDSDLFTYDSDRITKYEYDGDTWTFEYTDGTLTTVETDFGYSYDLTYSGDNLSKIEAEYTDQGNVETSSYTMTYDENGRITEITVGAESESYEYDSDGNLVTKSGGGDFANYTYDDKINPISRLNLPTAVIVLILDYEFESALSANNPLTAVENESDGLVRNGTYTYTYNEDDYPLTAVVVFVDSLTETDEYIFTYDCM